MKSESAGELNEPHGERVGDIWSVSPILVSVDGPKHAEEEGIDDSVNDHAGVKHLSLL